MQNDDITMYMSGDVLPKIGERIRIAGKIYEVKKIDELKCLDLYCVFLAKTYHRDYDLDEHYYQRRANKFWRAP